MSNPTHINLSDGDAHFDLKDQTTYGEYLRLDLILQAQKPKSTAHDEHMFIVIHQVSELWLGLILHEMQAAHRLIAEDQLGPVFKILSRVSSIQEQLARIWDVVTTLTPVDYLNFRDVLGQASGFQSYQYRMVEFALGNKSAKLAEVFAYDKVVFERVTDVLIAPSLYDESLRLLKRRGFDLPEIAVDRDWSQPYQPSDAVQQAWQTVYTHSDAHWDLYELAEKLVDVEEQFQRWRFNHFKGVERLIGYRKGTGGTSGAAYLEKALKLRFFPELFAVRTSL